MKPAQLLILHHYPGSPFAEKIRLILGFKGLHWSSVIIPNVMPKPDVIALTGGYRKTPVLQIGGGYLLRYRYHRRGDRGAAAAAHAVSERGCGRIRASSRNGPTRRYFGR